MRLTPQQQTRLVQMVFDHWKKNHVIQFKTSEKEAFDFALDSVKKEYQKEADLEKEVLSKLDELERQQGPGSFQRGKMFHLLKQKLAAERKIIL